MQSVPLNLSSPRHRLLVGAALATTLAFGFAGCAADDGDETSPQSVDPVAEWQAQGAKIIAEAHCGSNPMTCKGAALPKGSLKDFNPTSATFEKSTTVGALSGKPKVVALLAAW